MSTSQESLLACSGSVLSVSEQWDYARFPVTYPCISVWEPWASLIAASAKPYEFRKWPSLKKLIGQRVAIQASAHPISVREMKVLRYQLERQPDELGSTGLIKSLAIPIIERAISAPKGFPMRHVLCIATHGTPIRNEELARALGSDRLLDSERPQETNWGWPLTDIEVLEPPVRWTGRQGWYTWTRSA